MRIWKEGNSLFLVDGDIQKMDHASDVNIHQNKEDGNKFVIQSERLGINNYNITEIQKKNGDQYTLEEFKNFLTHQTGETNTISILDIQRGNIPNHSIMRAFGERESGNVAITGEDVWRGEALTPSGGEQIPLPPDAGDLMTVTSEGTGDSIAGVGVQKLAISYIKPDGTAAETIIDLNGGSVDTGILMRFVQEIYSAQVGSNGVASDNVKIHKTGDTATVYNMIAAGGNQSITTNRMVPLGHTLQLQAWDCSEAQGKRAAFRIRSTSKDGVLTPRVFLFKDVFYLNKSASANMPVFDSVPELAVVKITQWNDSVGSESSASWWGILIKI